MNFREFLSNSTAFGHRAAIYDVAIRGANRAILLKVLKGVKIEATNPSFLEWTKPYTFERLSPDKVLRFVHNGEFEMTHEFAEDALAKGDECFGFFCGEVLASYGWYSMRPTAIDPPDLVVHFDPRWVYMYKGFTHVDHRGHRLHAIGITNALAHYLARGYKGVVSYVESNNFNSLKSVYRMGFQDFGKIYVVGIAGRYWTRSDAGCAPYEFRLEQSRPQPAVRTKAAA